MMLLQVFLLSAEEREAVPAVHFWFFFDCVIPDGECGISAINQDFLNRWVLV